MDREARTGAAASPEPANDPANDPAKTITTLSPEQAKQQIDAGDVLLIDVGEAWQLRERGTIAGARNISHDTIAIKADAEHGRRDPALRNRDRKIILTCGGGGKAKRAAATLLEIGFTDVAVVQGGCRGWQKAGLELEPYRAPDGDDAAPSRADQ